MKLAHADTKISVAAKVGVGSTLALSLCVALASCVGDESQIVPVPVGGDGGVTEGGGGGADANGNQNPDGSGGSDGGGAADAEAGPNIGPMPVAKGDLSFVTDLADPFGGNGSGLASAVDKSGNFYFAGQITAPYTQPGTLNTYTPAPGKIETFIAKYSPTGTQLAFNIITTNVPDANAKRGNVTAMSIAVDDDGELYVVGSTTGKKLGFTSFTNPVADAETGPTECGFILRAHTTDLSIAWATAISPIYTFGSFFPHGCTAVSARNHQLVVGCNIGGDVPVTPKNVGGISQLKAYSGTAGDIAVISLDEAAGTVLWGNVLGGVDVDGVDGVAIAPDGSVRVGVRFVSNLLQARISNFSITKTTNGQNGAVISLDGASGTPQWSAHFKAAANAGGNSDPLHAVVVGVDAYGNTWAGGGWSGTDVDFGSGTATSPGGAAGSLYLVKLDALGNYKQEVVFGRTGSTSSYSLGVDPWGSAVFSAISLGGNVTLPAPAAPITFPTGTSETAPILFKVDPTGKVAWAKQFDNSNADDVVDCYGGIGVGPTGAVGLSGFINGTWTVDTKTINPTAGSLVSDGGRGADRSRYYGFVMGMTP